MTPLDRTQPPPDALFEIMRLVRSLVGVDSACFLEHDCLDFTVPYLQYLDDNDAVVFSPDGRYLKVARLSGAQLWDAERLEPIGAPFPRWPGPMGGDPGRRHEPIPRHVRPLACGLNDHDANHRRGAPEWRR